MNMFVPCINTYSKKKKKKKKKEGIVAMAYVPSWKAILQSLEQTSNQAIKKRISLILKESFCVSMLERCEFKKTLCVIMLERCD